MIINVGWRKRNQDGGNEVKEKRTDKNVGEAERQPEELSSLVIFVKKI